METIEANGYKVTPELKLRLGKTKLYFKPKYTGGLLAEDTKDFSELDGGRGKKKKRTKRCEMQ